MLRKWRVCRRAAIVLVLASIMAMLVVEPSLVHAAGYQMMLTTNPHYDRNPSVLKASNGTWWLFFTRGRDDRGVRKNESYNPDLDYYDIYCKTAESPQDLQGAPEYKMPLTPPDNAQRDIAALQAGDGKIWVFAATGLGPGANRSMYYYINTGGSWSGPTAINGTDYAAHIDALESGGNVWIFYDIGYSLYALQLGGSPVLITPNATLGKAIASGGTFYVAWAHVEEAAGIWGDYIGLSTSDDGSTWTNHGAISAWPGLTNWDPVLFKDEGLFRLFWAPSNSEQFIATSQSTSPADPSSWSIPVRLTTASYGSEAWWDFWPEAAQDETSGIVLFYTSESSDDHTHMIDGNIWVMGLPPALADLEDFPTLPTNDMTLIVGDITLNPHGSKPAGVGYQQGRDTTPLGFVSGMLANPQPSIFDTNATWINATSGRPFASIPPDLIFSIGGPGINAVTHYYENTGVATDMAPVKFSYNSTHFYWAFTSNGSIVPGSAVPQSSTNVPPGTSDVFVIQVLHDADGRLVVLMYGTRYTGTWAAAWWFKFVVYPNIASYTDSYYIVRWTDAPSGPGSDYTPDYGDTYEILAQGS